MAMKKKALEAAITILSAVPHFPAAEETRVVLEQALGRNFEDTVELRRVCLTAVDQMKSWGGIATLLEIRDQDRIHHAPMPEWKRDLLARQIETPEQ